MKQGILIATLYAVNLLITGIVHAGNGDLIVQGSLGVGTQPSTKAEVNGNLKVNGTITSTGATISSTGTTINGTISSKGETVNGNSSVTGTLSVGNKVILSGTISGGTFGFGGMYSYNASDGACNVAHPFTNACNCPLGHTPVCMDCTGTNDAYNKIVMCYKK